MENKLHILEPVIVLVTCKDGCRIKYDDYCYCGNGMLAYYNPDYARYPKENNFYECFGKFSGKYGPVYYIPKKYIDEDKTYKFKRLTLVASCSLNDFEVSKIIDADTIDNCGFNDGYFWFDKFKEDVKRHIEMYKNS